MLTFQNKYGIKWEKAIEEKWIGKVWQNNKRNDTLIPISFKAAQNLKSNEKNVSKSDDRSKKFSSYFKIEICMLINVQWWQCNHKTKNHDDLIATLISIKHQKRSEHKMYTAQKAAQKILPSNKKMVRRKKSVTLFCSLFLFQNHIFSFSLY